MKTIFHHLSRIPSPLLVARVPAGDGVAGGARLGLQGRSQQRALAHGLQEGDQGGGGRPQEPHSSQGRHHRRRPLQADQGEWCSGLILRSSSSEKDFWVPYTPYTQD